MVLNDEKLNNKQLHYLQFATIQWPSIAIRLVSICSENCGPVLLDCSISNKKCGFEISQENNEGVPLDCLAMKEIMEVNIMGETWH